MTKKLGISPAEPVNYHEQGDKGIIEIDLIAIRSSQSSQEEELDVYTNILCMAEDVGMEDWSLNHDHYLCGTPKRSHRESDG
ncbi:MAG: hypothetical protein ACE5JB_13480 [bacterium]